MPGQMNQPYTIADVFTRSSGSSRVDLIIPAAAHRAYRTITPITQKNIHCLSNQEVTPQPSCPVTNHLRPSIARNVLYWIKFLQWQSDSRVTGTSTVGFSRKGKPPVVSLIFFVGCRKHSSHSKGDKPSLPWTEECFSRYPAPPR